MGAEASATSYSNEGTASQVVPSSSFFRRDRKGLSIIPLRPPTLCFHATRSFETLLALVVLPVHATRRDFSLLVDLLLTFHGTRWDRTHIVRVLPRVDEEGNTASSYSFVFPHNEAICYAPFFFISRSEHLQRARASPNTNRTHYDTNDTDQPPATPHQPLTTHNKEGDVQHEHASYSEEVPPASSHWRLRFDIGRNSSSRRHKLVQNLYASSGTAAHQALSLCPPGRLLERPAIGPFNYPLAKMGHFRLTARVD